MKDDNHAIDLTGIYKNGKVNQIHDNPVLARLVNKPEYSNNIAKDCAER